MPEFFVTLFTNPVVIIILIIVLAQMGFSIARSYFMVREAKRNAEDMEKMLQESEARMRGIIKNIEDNRRQLTESLNRLNDIQQKSSEKDS